MSVTTEEGWHVTEDGARLYTKTWKPAGETKAILVFVHGFSDHCNAYPFFFEHLASRSIAVHSYDQRGWGRTVTTPASRGLSGPTSLILSDLTSFITPLLPPAAPLFLMGHSMGGGIALTYPSYAPAATTVLPHLRGILVESPLIALAPTSAANKLVVILGKLASKVLPNHQLVQKLDPSLMSRDPEVCRAFKEDPLCHDTGTLEGLSCMLDRGEKLVRGEVKLRDDYGGGKTGVWVGHGSGDKVTSWEASKKWVAESPLADKEYREYDGWYHKLHAEPEGDKKVFADDVAGWILARLGPRKEGQGEEEEGEGDKAKL